MMGVHAYHKNIAIHLRMTTVGIESFDLKENSSLHMTNQISM